MIAVWCPDWPVTAVRAPAGSEVPADPPIAVVSANHVVACSQAARQAGVRRGMRRREAQSRCPDLAILPRDEAAEARAFEPVLTAIESLAPGVEISRPGLAAVGTRGPTRYFGGETAVLHALSRALADLPGDLGRDAMIGIADGSFAAEQAARRGVIVAPGESAAFLAELSVDTLGLPELADLLRRLGVHTLAAFAALPAADVLARFGPAGAWAHRQAGGRDARPIAARPPATEYAVDVTFEPALDNAEAITFSARSSAERFVSDLSARGLACTCLELVIRTEPGPSGRQEAVRRWRHSGVLGTVDVLDRVRWQLDAWLSARRAPNAPAAGVELLRLTPVECVPFAAHQQALWGASGADDDRAHRALARVATMLGHGAVLTAVPAGGRDPAERTRLVPWGEERSTPTSAAQPWPGRLPAPAPSVLLDPPRPIEVHDTHHHPVTVTDRGAVPAPPTLLRIGAGPPVPITAWAGPWPVDDRWWDAAGPPQRRARFQLVDLRGRAYLVTCTVPGPPAGRPGNLGDTGNLGDEPGGPTPPQWTLDAVYD